MISVIIPVYNTKKYVKRCIESILSQTYNKFELILVDDGSTDGSGPLLDHLAENNPKITVYHTHNQGPAAARNYGVSMAKGEYITLIDSDDFVKETYLETLWSMHETYEPDICVVGMEYHIPKKNPKKSKKEPKTILYTGYEALKNMLYQNGMDTTACGLLLPAELVRRNPFPQGKLHEDDFTTYKFYATARRVAVSNRTEYQYLQREGSIMHNGCQFNTDELDAADNLVKFCEDNYRELVPAAKSKKFSDYSQVFINNWNLKKDYPDVYRRIVGFLRSYWKDQAKDKNARKKNRIAGLLVGIRPGLLRMATRM